jgi:uncharacterized membrane protein SpoIIM required for sporulation
VPEPEGSGRRPPPQRPLGSGAEARAREPIAAFAARRRPDWDALAQLLRKLDARRLELAEVEALDRLYRRAASDLARAQRDYAGTEVQRALNALCARAYARIYRTPRDRGAALRRFYRVELPALVQAERRFVLASAALLLLGVAVGALAVMAQPPGAETLVPEAVRQSVDEGEMWTDVLSLSPPEAVASRIATNNLAVVVATFAGGLLFGLGTGATLLFNGALLGAVGVYCARHGMLGRLLLFIGAHGPVELSVIVLAGAAGLMLANALLDPGDLPRGAHLQARGRRGAALVLGCAPFLALIGLVEGYVSPAPFLPGWAKVAAGAALGAALWGYLLLGGRGREARDATSSPEPRGR